MKETTEPSLSEILDKLHGPPITAKRWNKFVDEFDPFIDQGAITAHGVLAFFWLLTREYRQTPECKKKVAELCAKDGFKDEAEVLGLSEPNQ